MKTRIILIYMLALNGLLLQAQNVGIGVANPLTKLDILGDLRVGHHPTDTMAGRIRFNPGLKMFEGFDSLNWMPLQSQWTRATGNNIYKKYGNVGINYKDCIGQLGIISQLGSSVENIEVERDNTGIVLQASIVFDQTNPFLIEMDRITTNTAYARLAISNTYTDQFTIHRGGEVGFGTNRPGEIEGFKSALVEFATNNETQSTWVLRLATDVASQNSSVMFGKSKNNITSPQIVQARTNFGGFLFMGYDGNEFAWTAQISCRLDGTASLDDMPGRIVFYTCWDGARMMSEKMQITNNGYVGILPYSTYNEGGYENWSPSGILDVRGRTSSSGNGTHINLYAQNGRAVGSTNGGNIIFYTGLGNGTGTRGCVGINTTSPVSTLNVEGSISLPNIYHNLGPGYYYVPTDYCCILNGGGYAYLPTAASATGRIYVIKKNPGGGNTIQITPVTGELIEGASSYTLSSTMYSATIQSDGTSWYVLY